MKNSRDRVTTGSPRARARTGMIWLAAALMAAMTVVAMTVVATAARAGALDFVNEQYEVKTIGPGIYAFIAPESDSGVVQSNCILVIGKDAALLVDTGQFPSLARRMISDIRKLAAVPVRYIVNTHWHFDHVWGNQSFRDAYPGVVILGTNFTREMDEAEGPKALKTQPDVNKKQAEQTRQLVKSSNRSHGKKLSPAIKQRLTRLADTLDHIEADLAETSNAPASIGFEDSLSINLGERVVKLMWLGRANTGGDALVWISDAKLLMTGDTVVAPTPFAFGSYISEWPAVLQKALAMNPETIIPGHGPVMHDFTYVKLMIDALQSVWQEVRQCVMNGMTLEQTHQKVTLAAMASRFAGTDEFRLLAFRDAFLHPAIDRAFQEANGDLKPETEE